MFQLFSIGDWVLFVPQSPDWLFQNWNTQADNILFQNKISAHSMMGKFRGFSVVLHDVQDGYQTKQNVIDHVMAQNPTQVVVAEEPSPEPGKTHIHVFYRFDTTRHFSANLKLWVLWWKSGRAQVDRMEGTMAQACRYLMDGFTKKDKHTDPDPFFYPSKEIAKSPQEHADEWFDWFLSNGVGAQQLTAYSAQFIQAYRQYAGDYNRTVSLVG